MPHVTQAWDTQAMFRRANEDLLVSSSQAFAAEPEALAPFLCECADRRCTRVLRLTIADYERTHSDPTQFIILPGHEVSAEVEHVVERGNGFLVVRKLDVGAGATSR